MFTPTKLVVFLTAAVLATAQVPSGSAPPSTSTTFTGKGTVYSPGLGECGIFTSDTQNVAAVSAQFFDHFPGYDGKNAHENPLCGKTAVVAYKDRSVEVKLTDRCETCAFGDLEFSHHAFKELADPAGGPICDVMWKIRD